MDIGRVLLHLLEYAFYVALSVTMLLLCGCSTQKRVKTEDEEEITRVRFEASDVTARGTELIDAISVRIDSTKLGIVRTVTTYDTDKAVLEDGKWKSPVLSVEEDRISLDNSVTEKDTVTKNMRTTVECIAESADSSHTDHKITKEETLVRSTVNTIKDNVMALLIGIVVGLLIVVKLRKLFPFKH